MHPYHLEVMAADRRRDLITAAERDRLTRHARYAATRTHSRARVLIAFDAVSAYARRSRRRLRAAFSADRLMWREEVARNREPNHGF
jgi:hypothetical protein